MTEDQSEQSSPLDPAAGLSADEWAARLATQYGGRLRVFAARRLRDRSAAEDVAQETLRRVLEAMHADRVRDFNAIAGFVFETARHICMQRSRKHAREASAIDRLSRTPQFGAPKAAPDPLSELISEEQSAAVRAAIARLDDADRQIIRWSYVDNLDGETIAHQLGITPGAARARRHRALQRLAAILDVTRGHNRELKRQA